MDGIGGGECPGNKGGWEGGEQEVTVSMSSRIPWGCRGRSVRRMILGEWNLWRKWLGLGRTLFSEDMETDGGDRFGLSYG